MVISATRMPPRKMASIDRMAPSVLSVRTTGTIPASTIAARTASLFIATNLRHAVTAKPLHFVTHRLFKRPELRRQFADGFAGIHFVLSMDGANSGHGYQRLATGHSRPGLRSGAHCERQGIGDFPRWSRDASHALERGEDSSEVEVFATHDVAFAGQTPIRRGNGRERHVARIYDRGTAIHNPGKFLLQEIQQQFSAGGGRRVAWAPHP